MDANQYIEENNQKLRPHGLTIVKISHLRFISLIYFAGGILSVIILASVFYSTASQGFFKSELICGNTTLHCEAVQCGSYNITLPAIPKCPDCDLKCPDFPKTITVINGS